MKRFSFTSLVRPSLLTAFAAGASIGVLGTGIAATTLGSSVFSDVEKNSYYDSAVGDMYSLGIIKGYDSGKFGPNDPVTRAQVAVMMQRLRNELTGGGGVVKSSSSSSSSSSVSSTPANAAGTIQFTSPTYTVSESTTTAAISVIRSGGTEGAVSIQYAATAGTATAASDFELTNGTLSFADGESNKTFTVTIINDTATESTETINLTLSSVTGGASLGSVSTATLSITDNDVSTSSVNGTVRYSASEYSIGEDGGSVTITVERIGGSEGAVTINYATSNGTGLAGTHYTSAAGTLSFGAGETTKTFTVAVVDNEDVQGNKTVNLTLNTPTGGVVLSSTPTSIITIIDTDNESLTYGTGSFKFSKSTYDVNETDGTAVVVVKRIGGSAHDVTVNYSTASATATAGGDYTTTSGTLTFRAGEAEKSISIPILADSTTEGTEYFSVSLNSPTKGSTLGSPSSANVEISG